MDFKCKVFIYGKAPFSCSGKAKQGPLFCFGPLFCLVRHLQLTRILQDYPHIHMLKFAECILNIDFQKYHNPNFCLTCLRKASILQHADTFLFPHFP